MNLFCMDWLRLRSYEYNLLLVTFNIIKRIWRKKETNNFRYKVDSYNENNNVLSDPAGDISSHLEENNECDDGSIPQTNEKMEIKNTSEDATRLIEYDKSSNELIKRTAVDDSIISNNSDEIMAEETAE